jgi:hypothetical protein
MIFKNEASKVKGRPSQRRHLKSPDLKCQLVAGLLRYEISPANHGMKKMFMYMFTLGIFFRFEGNSECKSPFTFL